MRKGLSASYVLLLLLLLPAGCRVFKASPQVAFIGDSLTEGWPYPSANFGIYGNTTAQMLQRFPALIPGKGFRQVVILGGTNDVLLGIDPETTIRNLEKIANLSVRAGAQPLLCEIPPIFHSFTPSDKADYSGKVRALNQRIVALAAKHNWLLIDYYHPLLGHPHFVSDGVHMKKLGYAVMERAYLEGDPTP